MLKASPFRERSKVTWCLPSWLLSTLWLLAYDGLLLTALVLFQLSRRLAPPGDPSDWPWITHALRTCTRVLAGSGLILGLLGLWFVLC